VCEIGSMAIGSNCRFLFTQEHRAIFKLSLAYSFHSHTVAGGCYLVYTFRYVAQRMLFFKNRVFKDIFMRYLPTSYVLREMS